MTDHEYRARKRKANVLASILREHGITQDQAKRMTPAEWKTVAECASRQLGEMVHPPHSETTRQEVYDRLSVDEAKPKAISIEDFRRIGV